MPISFAERVFPVYSRIRFSLFGFAGHTIKTWPLKPYMQHAYILRAQRACIGFYNWITIKERRKKNRPNGKMGTG